MAATTSGTLDRLRAETPGCANRIHFNNAGAGLMPEPVVRAMIEHLELEAQIGGYEAAEARADAAGDFYAATGELLGCDRRNVAFTANATDAYARALSSVPFETGDVILTTEDDYVSNQIAFMSLRKRFGVEVVQAPRRPEGGIDPDVTGQLLRDLRPRVVAVTHVPTNSGLIQPVEEIGRHCRELDLLYIVDACQSFGQLPVDVGAIGCDYLTVTCRKFLRGPRGAGLLFASDRVLEQGYEPLFIDTRGAHWTEPDEYEPVAGAQRFEDWEFSYAALIGTAVAVRYALRVGIEAIAERATALGAELRRGLAEIPGVRVLDEGRELAAIVTVVVDGHEATEVADALAHREINSSVSLRAYAVYDFSRKGVDGVVRLSPHYYNSEDEVRLVVQAVAEIAASA